MSELTRDIVCDETETCPGLTCEDCIFGRMNKKLIAERAKSSSLQKIIDEVDDTYCTGLRAEHERQLKAEQEKVKKLKEALGFYGDCENHKVFKIITHIDGVHFDLDQKVFRDGGKLARQALKEVESV